MRKIMECVPNFSEGRDLSKVERLADAFRSKPGVKLLNYSADPDHNRCVITAVGEPLPLRNAVVEAIGAAIELIDLRTHRGQHPRMGAADVVPFIPLQNCTMEEADTLAKDTATCVAERYQLPVYLYEQSAVVEHHRNLADLRRGEFEGMLHKMQDALWRPDLGPHAPHPTAGVTAIGARGPLVAYNILLDTDDVEIARDIARKVRFSSGGLPALKAIGLMMEANGKAQVSMNLTDYHQTGLYAAWEAVRAEAEQMGVRLLSSELIGLVPMEALAETAARFLKLEGFHMNRVLENHLME